MNELHVKKNGYWLTFGICALGALLMFLPFLIVDKGLFLYAGDFNSQQIPFYYYANQFAKQGGSYSWATDLGSGFLNSYAFYLAGSPFWWLSLLFPAKAVPFLMVPLLILKFAFAGAGAQLWMRRWVKHSDWAILGGCLYAFSGFTIYNVFFNHFVDVVALFPYLLWALDAAVLEKRRGAFAALVALNLINNFFFFAGQVVFLAIYFICLAISGAYKIRAKAICRLAIESLLGCGMGCVLALPAVLFLLDNPRAIDPMSGYRYLLYGSSQQYGAILYNLFFPPDSPYMTVIFDKGVIKWTSLSAYLPLVSFAGVWAYLRCKHRDGFKNILYVCLIMAFVPVLNSAFYAFNASYYARWFYMPVLIMSLATVNAVQDEDVKIEKGLVPTLLVLLSFCAFAFVPVKPEKEGESWTMGVIDEPAMFWLSFGLALMGVAAFWMLLLLYEKDKKLPRRLCAAVMVFAVIAGVSHISVGKFSQWSKDKNWRSQQYETARQLAEKLPEGAYRVDAYECYDNIGIWMNKSSMNCFHSTVSPSIMEFYKSLGIKRDVRSKVNLEKYALRSLLGVKYTVTPTAKRTDFEEAVGGDWKLQGELGQLSIYENAYTLPMAYTYENYVTGEEFEKVYEANRPNLLMRALVLSQEQVEDYGHLLQPLTDIERAAYTEDRFKEDYQERLTHSAQAVELNNRGLTAKISLPRENLVFFAVPFDKGFKAAVNGADAPVLKVSNGMLAVPAPAGENEIVLCYHTPGLTVAVSIAAISLILFGLWLFVGKKLWKEDFAPQEQPNAADEADMILSVQEAFDKK